MHKTLSTKLPFKDLLAIHLHEAGLSRHAFATRVGCPGVLPGHMITGKRAPPLDMLVKMATVLRLTGASQKRFLLEGRLAHCPDDLAEILRDLMVVRDELMRKIPALNQAVAALDAVGASTPGVAMSPFDHLLDAADTLDDAAYAQFAEAVAAEAQRRAEADRSDRGNRGR